MCTLTKRLTACYTVHLWVESTGCCTLQNFPSACFCFSVNCEKELTFFQEHRIKAPTIASQNSYAINLSHPKRRDMQNGVNLVALKKFFIKTCNI